MSESIPRTVIVLPGSALWSTEPFDDISDRIEAARSSVPAQAGTEVMAIPMVRTSVVLDLNGPFAASFNPLSVVAVYEHPDGDQAA